MSHFSLYKKENDKIIKSNKLGDIFSNPQKKLESWMFIIPHDDDAVIGSGLLLQKAISEGINISIIITSDGSLGYCAAEQKDTIASIRKQETLNSFNTLGITDITWLDFPDNRLMNHIGRKTAAENDPNIIQGFTGLENSYTWYLREKQPDRVFIAAETDFHPDHKIVYQEALISFFHAAGEIWPELGKPLAVFPKVYEMAIYCNFSSPPDIKIQGSEKHLAKKIEAIRLYKSQKQIELLIENIREFGPVEYFRDVNFNFYSPDKYKDLFETTTD